MRLDRSTTVAKGDSLIMKYGTMLLHKQGRKRALDVDDFITLYGSKFTDKFSSLANASLRIKGNALAEYPDE